MSRTEQTYFEDEYFPDEASKNAYYEERVREDAEYQEWEAIHLQERDSWRVKKIMTLDEMWLAVTNLRNKIIKQFDKRHNG